jgi:hypothetical protein
MAVKKISLKELTIKISEDLNTEVKKLPSEHQRIVEPITNFNTWGITNAFGKIGIIPVSGKLDPSDHPDAIVQKHDVGIGVIVAMRHVLDHPWPIEYVELCMDALTGLYLENNRPERLVYPIGWEPLENKWQNGEWWYQVTMACPIDHYEKRFEEQLINH